MSLLSVINYRPAEPQDYNLVLDSWIKTFKSSPYAGIVAADEYHATTRDAIEKLIARGAKLVMAVADNDREQIIGWVCYEISLEGVPVVHYVYVKGGRDTKGNDLFRGKGLGTSLLKKATQGAAFLHTFRTADGNRLTRNKGRHVPFLARRKNLEPVRRIEAA